MDIKAKVSQMYQQTRGYIQVHVWFLRWPFTRRYALILFSTIMLFLGLKGTYLAYIHNQKVHALALPYNITQRLQQEDEARLQLIRWIDGPAKNLTSRSSVHDGWICSRCFNAARVCACIYTCDVMSSLDDRPACLLVHEIYVNQNECTRAFRVLIYNEYNVTVNTFPYAHSRHIMTGPVRLL